jgi:hypothetical protein
MRELDVSDPLEKRIATLYNQIYKVTLTPAGGVPIQIKAGDVNLDASKVGASSGDQITVGVNGTTSANAGIKHLEIDARDSPGGVQYVVGRNVTSSTDNKTDFSWALMKLFSSSGPSSGDDIWDKVISSTSSGVKFEQNVRRGSDGELEIEVSKGNYKKLSDVRQSVEDGTACKAAHDDCEALLKSCLMKENKDGSPIALTDAPCVSVLKDAAEGTLWKATKEDVQKMNPKAAFSLLKNLGFKGKKTDSNRIVFDPLSSVSAV